MSTYSFGHQTAEFLVCGQCGVYVAAVSLDSNEQRGILQARVLDEHRLFADHVTAVDYVDESQAGRIARHQRVWMPVSIDVG